MNVQSHTFVDATLTVDVIAAIKAANRWQEAAAPLLKEYNHLDDARTRLMGAEGDKEAAASFRYAADAIGDAIKVIFMEMETIRDSYIREAVGTIPDGDEGLDEFFDLQGQVEAEVTCLHRAICDEDDQMDLRLGRTSRILG